MRLKERYPPFEMEIWCGIHSVTIEYCCAGRQIPGKGR
jgi:hypothetical protein